MRLEVWEITPSFDVTTLTDSKPRSTKANWGAHFEGGSDTTFTASGYDTKSIATTALCNHMIASEAFLRGTSVKAVPVDRKKEIRAMVRAQVKVLA